MIGGESDLKEARRTPCEVGRTIGDCAVECVLGRELRELAGLMRCDIYQGCCL